MAGDVCQECPNRRKKEKRRRDRRRAVESGVSRPRACMNDRPASADVPWHPVHISSGDSSGDVREKTKGVAVQEDNRSLDPSGPCGRPLTRPLLPRTHASSDWGPASFNPPFLLVGFVYHDTVDSTTRYPARACSHWPDASC